MTYDDVASMDPELFMEWLAFFQVKNEKESEATKRMQRRGGKNSWSM